MFSTPARPFPPQFTPTSAPMSFSSSPGMPHPSMPDPAQQVAEEEEGDEFVLDDEADYAFHVDVARLLKRQGQPGGEGEKVVLKLASTGKKEDGEDGASSKDVENMDLEAKLPEKKEEKQEEKKAKVPSPLVIPAREYDFSPITLNQPFSPMMVSSPMVGNSPMPPPTFPCSLPPSLQAPDEPLGTTSPMFGSFKGIHSPSTMPVPRPEDEISLLDFTPPRLPEIAIRQPFSPFEDRKPVPVNLSQGFSGFSFGGMPEKTKATDSLVDLSIHGLARYLEKVEEETGTMPKLDALNEDLLQKVINTFRMISPIAVKACIASALREVTRYSIPQLSFDEVLEQVAAHCPNLNKLNWFEPGGKVNGSKLRTAFEKCALTHLELQVSVSMSSLQLDLAACLPQLKSLRLTASPFSIRIGFLLKHLLNLGNLVVERCKIAGNCDAKSVSLDRLVLNECVLGRLRIEAPSLTKYTISHCTFGAGVPTIVTDKLESFIFRCTEKSLADVCSAFDQEWFLGLRKATINAHLSSQQFSSLLNRLQQCRTLETLAFGPPWRQQFGLGMSPPDNLSRKPSVILPRISLPHLKTLYLSSDPIDWQASVIDWDLPRLQNLEISSSVFSQNNMTDQAATKGITAGSLVSVLEQTHKTLRRCVVLAQAWDAEHAHRWHRLNLPQLHEAALQTIGSESQLQESREYSAAFYHIAPGLKHFAYYGIPIRSGFGTTMTFPQQQQQLQPGSSLFSSPFGLPQPSAAIEKPQGDRALDWSTNCKRLNELVIQTRDIDQARLTEILEKSRELHTLMINPSSNFNDFSFNQSTEQTLRVNLSAGNVLSTLRMQKFVLDPLSTIQSSGIVTLNLLGCNLSAITSTTSGGKPSAFFTSIAVGCPALKNLLFELKTSSSSPFLQMQSNTTAALDGALLPILPFPKLELLSVAGQGITNNDLIQIATNCYNLHSLLLQQGSSGMNLAQTRQISTIIDEDRKHRGEEEDVDGAGALSMPNLRFLILQGVICTDSVLRSVVHSAPNLQVLDAAGCSCLLAPKIRHPRLKVISFSRCNMLGADDDGKGLQLECGNLTKLDIGQTKLKRHMVERIVRSCVNLKEFWGVVLSDLFTRGGAIDVNSGTAGAEETEPTDMEVEGTKGKEKDLGEHQPAVPTLKIQSPRLNMVYLTGDMSSLFGGMQSQTPQAQLDPLNIVLIGEALQKIHLAGTPVTDESLRRILEACPKVQELSLARCPMLSSPDFTTAKNLRTLSLTGSGIHSLEITEANSRLKMLDFDQCAHLKQARLRVKRFESPEYTINHSAELREVEIWSENLEKLSVSNCPALDNVVVQVEAHKFRAISFSDCKVSGQCLQRCINALTSVEELGVANNTSLDSLDLKIGEDGKLKKLTVNNCANLQKVRVQAKQLERLSLQGNGRLRKVWIDCENLKDLVPSNLLGLEHSQLWSSKTVSQSKLEKVVVRSKRLSRLRMASLPSLRQFALEGANLKELMLKDFNSARFEDGMDVEELLRKNKELEAVCLVNVALEGDTQVFDLPNLQLLAYSATPNSVTSFSRSDPGSGSSGTNAFTTKQTFTIGCGSAEEVVIRSPRLQVLFLTGLVNLRAIKVTDVPLDVLEWVDLGGCLQLRDDSLKALTERCMKLRKLILRGCARLTDRCVGWLNKLSPSLEILDMNETGLRNPEFHLSELKHLDMGGCAGLRGGVLDCGELRSLVVNEMSGDVGGLLGGVTSRKLQSLWLQHAKARKQYQGKRKRDKGKEKDVDGAGSRNEGGGKLAFEELEVLDVSGSKLEAQLVDGLISGSRKLNCLVARFSTGCSELVVERRKMSLVMMNECQTLRRVVLRDVETEQITLTGCPRLEEVEISSDTLKGLGVQQCPNLHRLELRTPQLSSLMLGGGRDLDLATIIRAVVQTQTTAGPMGNMQINVDETHRLSQQDIAALRGAVRMGVNLNFAAGRGSPTLY